MKEERLPWLLIAMLVAQQPCWSQGMMEQGGLYSSVAGLGAGLAASRGHGEVVNRSYEAMIRAQQAIATQTKAIEVHMAKGCQFEASKEWENAEKSFKYVLQIVSRRDGPGSTASLPALKHLVTVCHAQNKLDDAINYQKTVIAFTKAGKVPDPSVPKLQLDLCQMLVEKQDYASAEPVLKEVVQADDSKSTLSNEQRCAALTTYNEVLSRLNKPGAVERKQVAIQMATPNPIENAEPAVSPRLEASQLLSALLRIIHRQYPDLLTIPHNIAPPIEESSAEMDAAELVTNQPLTPEQLLDTPITSQAPTPQQLMDIQVTNQPPTADQQNSNPRGKEAAQMGRSADNAAELAPPTPEQLMKMEVEEERTAPEQPIGGLSTKQSETRGQP
jgi:hypothetical protein